jgi:hypothetical protein
MCCADYRKAWADGRIQVINGTIYLDEILVLGTCPWCGKKFRF